MRTRKGRLVEESASNEEEANEESGWEKFARGKQKKAMVLKRKPKRDLLSRIFYMRTRTEAVR